MIRISLLLYFVLQGILFVQTQASYFELKNCHDLPAYKNSIACKKAMCTDRLHDFTMEPLQSKGDLKWLTKKEKHVHFGAVEGQEWSWTYNKFKNRNRLSITAFFRPKGEKNGVPVSTCCRVRLKRGKCRINFDQAGDFFPGLSYRGEWLVSAKPFLEYYPSDKTVGTEKPVTPKPPLRKCYVEKKTYMEFCLIIEETTGIMRTIQRKIKTYSTNENDRNNDAIWSMGHLWTYELPEVVVRRNGAKLLDRTHVNQFFNRTVYDITQYWRKVVKNKTCTKHELPLNSNLTFATAPKHMLCYFFERCDGEHYCMAGHETGLSPVSRSRNLDDQHGVATSTLLVFVGVVFSTVLTLSILALWPRIKDRLRKLYSVPPELQNVLKETGKTIESEEPRFPISEKEEKFAESIPFVKPDSPIKSVTDIFANPEKQDSDSDGDSLTEEGYISGYQTNPFSGGYTDGLESGGSYMSNFGPTSSALSFPGSNFSQNFSYSGISDDTGRGTYSGQSEHSGHAAPVTRNRENNSFRFKPSVSQRTEKVMSNPDVVFLSADKDYTSDFPQPGTEISQFPHDCDAHSVATGYICVDH